MSEETGVDTTIATLQRELEEERKKTKLLQEEVKQTRLASMKHQKAVEEEEEYLVNQLTKKMEMIKREKEQMALAIEQEEEQLTNMLQKKLQRLQMDKIDMENELEAEEEYITNKLTKQLEVVMAEKRELERRVEAGSSELIHKLEETIARLKAEKEARGNARGRSVVGALNLRILDLETRVNKLEEENKRLRAENEEHSRASFLATQRALREKEKLDSLLTRQRSESVEEDLNVERLLNTTRRGSKDDGTALGSGAGTVTRGRRGPQRRTRSAANMRRGASLADRSPGGRAPLRLQLRQPSPTVRPGSPGSPRRMSPRMSPRPALSPRTFVAPRLARGSSTSAIISAPVPTARSSGSGTRSRPRAGSDSSEDGGISIGALAK